MLWQQNFYFKSPNGPFTGRFLLFSLHWLPIQLINKWSRTQRRKGATVTFYLLPGLNRSSIAHPSPAPAGLCSHYYLGPNHSAFVSWKQQRFTHCLLTTTTGEGGRMHSVGFVFFGFVFKGWADSRHNGTCIYLPQMCCIFSLEWKLRMGWVGGVIRIIS